MSQPLVDTPSSADAKSIEDQKVSQDSEKMQNSGTNNAAQESQGSAVKAKPVKAAHKKPKKEPEPSDQENTDSFSEDSSDDTEDSDSTSEDERPKKKVIKTAKRSKKTASSRSKRKTKQQDPETSDESNSDDDSESSSSSSDSEEDRSTKRIRSKRKANTHSRKSKTAKHSKSRKSREERSEDEDSTDSEVEVALEPTKAWAQIKSLHLKGVRFSKKLKDRSKEPKKAKDADDDKASVYSKKRSKTFNSIGKRGSKMDFVRVDSRWEDYQNVIRLTGEEGETGEYEDHVFRVRRILDDENKYCHTRLDIYNKPLRDAMRKVMAKAQSVSLVEDKPSIDPDIVFLYAEELRNHRQALKAKLKAASKKKLKRGKKHEYKIMKTQVKSLKVLLRYVVKDYRDKKKSLTPMLKNGTITFDYLWALFKPNEIVFAPTYGVDTIPRAFRVTYVYTSRSILRGEYLMVEGEYIDYDGTRFGKAEVEVAIDLFKGPRKITALACYPLKYHRDRETVRQTLIERGKKFEALKGMHFKFHQGMTFYKKEETQVIKTNVNGRVMVDPATFRRVNPNYTVSSVKKEDPDLLPDSDRENHCCDSSDGDDTANQFSQFDSSGRKTKLRKMVVEDSDNERHIINVVQPTQGNEVRTAQDDVFDEDSFTEDDYLMCSPVVLGFSFTEKLWVEFDVAGLRDIVFNEGAFDSLVLPDDQKQVIRALVESHSRKDSKNITDVISGKGEGLVTVLHGPPGCGKTLTAEGIAEQLKKPLYTVSIGELGTRGGDLEKNFTQIIDIAHTWSAILLLDEADVFLEKREVHDLSRNALVSIFLRLLEYFHGIVFLTTNRVVTFDVAFQSRIHIGLRYGDLSLKARKEIWRLFLDKAHALGASGDTCGVEEIRQSDVDKLATYELNGREIKNAVRTAQSLASCEKRKLGMEQLLKVLCVGNAFAKDLKGAGYEEAMKFYM